MIVKVILHVFNSFYNKTINLRKMNYLFGRCGSGKSTILQAISFVLNIQPSRTLEEYFLAHCDRIKKNKFIKVELILDDGTSLIRIIAKTDAGEYKQYFYRNKENLSRQQEQKFLTDLNINILDLTEFINLSAEKQIIYLANKLGFSVDELEQLNQQYDEAKAKEKELHTQVLRCRRTIQDLESQLTIFKTPEQLTKEEVQKIIQKIEDEIMKIKEQKIQEQIEKERKQQIPSTMLKRPEEIKKIMIRDDLPSITVSPPIAVPPPITVPEIVSNKEMVNCINEKIPTIIQLLEKICKIITTKICEKCKKEVLTINNIQTTLQIILSLLKNIIKGENKNE